MGKGLRMRSNEGCAQPPIPWNYLSRGMFRPSVPKDLRLPEQPHGGRRPPPARRSRRNQITDRRFRLAAPSRRRPSLKQSNAPPFSGPAARLRIRAFLYAGRPQLGPTLSGHPPEIRRAFFPAFGGKLLDILPRLWRFSRGRRPSPGGRAARRWRLPLLRPRGCCGRRGLRLRALSGTTTAELTNRPRKWGVPTNLERNQHE